MHRKGTLLILWAALLLITACGSSSSGYQAGTYEGVGKGYSEEGDIRLSVTIAEDGEIYEIKVLDSHETANIGGRALESLIEQAISTNNETIDTISGATRTTEGFRDALSSALKQSQEQE